MTTSRRLYETLIPLTGGSLLAIILDERQAHELPAHDNSLSYAKWLDDNGDAIGDLMPLLSLPQLPGKWLPKRPGRLPTASASTHMTVVVNASDCLRGERRRIPRGGRAIDAPRGVVDRSKGYCKTHVRKTLADRDCGSYERRQPPAGPME